MIFSFQASFNTTTQPAIGLSLLCLLLDIAKQLHDEENTNEEYLTVNHRFFYDGSFSYGSLDRVGGVLSHLNKVFKKELTEALGEDEPIPQVQESTNFLHDIYSTMFLVSNNSGTYSLVRNMLNDSNHIDVPVASGNVETHKSICEIIDCSIMFYHSVAYKYVVMIADLRDNITHLSNILTETKQCRDEVIKNLEEYKNSMEGLNSDQEVVLRELAERFYERKNIFAVS
jgi:Kip1 ubiquitination-promoting complex protein 1